MKNGKIRVLIIDDSAVVRHTLADIVASDDRLEVMATASDPFFAVEKIKEEVPDVITLDIEMPRMDGLTFLKALMAQHPIPVIIISSLTLANSKLALRAMDLGAVEIIPKENLKNTREYLLETQSLILQSLLFASQKRIERHRLSLQQDPMKPQKKTGQQREHFLTTDKIIAIGASTGGTEVIRFLLPKLPANLPGILISQHMPGGFTKAFAEALDAICQVNVREAQDGTRIMRGHVYIAPGGFHMKLSRRGAQYYVRVVDGPRVNRQRPSVDVLFRSVAQEAGPNALGILLTGMGKDGAQGLLEMKEARSETMAQDEASCAVYGMPKAAVALGAAKNYNLDDILLRVRTFPKKMAMERRR